MDANNIPIWFEWSEHVVNRKVDLIWSFRSDSSLSHRKLHMKNIVICDTKLGKYHIDNFTKENKSRLQRSAVL